MAETWILVADSARARLFEVASGDSSLEEIADFANPEGRIAQKELRRDRLPRTNESVGSARHAIEPHTSLEQKSTDRFAHTLARELAQGRAARRFKKLVLIAAPRFIGALHGAFDDTLRKCVVAEIKRNLTTMSAVKIRERLPQPLG